MAGAEICWGERTISSPFECELGDNLLRIKRVGDEVWIGTRFTSKLAEYVDHRVVEWSRWVAKRQLDRLQIVPLMPDKSVVVTPESPFSLLPEAQARVFVRIPVWAGIAEAPGAEEYIQQIPSMILSNTWFGTPIEGEMCYWISSSVRRDIRFKHPGKHLVICPIQMRNKSREQLHVEKICLRVRWLSLYQNGEDLWANDTRISFRGSEDASQVTVASGPPVEVPEAKLITRPRSELRRGFTIRTFLTPEDFR